MCRLLVVALLAALASVVAPSASPHLAPSASAAAAPRDGMFLMSARAIRGLSSEDAGTKAQLFHMPWSCVGQNKSAYLGGGVWSPDGTRIAGAKECNDGTDAIYVTDVDGGNAHEYTYDGLSKGWVSRITWVGGDMLIVSQNPTTYGAPFTTTGLSLVDGSFTTLLSGDYRDTLPSADGTKLASRCNGAGTPGDTLCVYDVTSQQTRQFAVGAAQSSRYAFSPDGSQLVFTQAKTVQLADLATGDVHTLADRSADASYISGLDWSPVDDSIVYGVYLAKHSELHVTHADGSDDHIIASGSPIVFSPSGHLVLFQADDYGYRTATLDGSLVGVDLNPAGDWQPCPTGTCAGPDSLSLPCTITGTNGPDVLVGTSGADVICGHGGNDRIVPGGGHDLVRGGSGSNTLDLRDSPRGVVVDIQAGTETGWGTVAMYAVEHAQGSAYDDVLKGDMYRNVLSGNGGNDDLLGFGGDDTMLGGPGNDYFRGGSGGDDIVGDDGIDQVSYSASHQRVRVNLGSGLATGEGEDMLISIERVAGSKYDDFIVGSDGRNVIWAGDGLDTVESGGGNDVIYGGDSKDYLYGQGGDDDLYGDGGADYLNGGTGHDHCHSALSRISC